MKLSRDWWPLYWGTNDRFTAFTAPNRNIKKSLIIHLHVNPISSLFFGRRGNHLSIIVTYLSGASFLVLIQKKMIHSVDFCFLWMRFLIVTCSLNRNLYQNLSFGFSVTQLMCVSLSDVLSFFPSVLFFLLSVCQSFGPSVCLPSVRLFIII